MVHKCAWKINTKGSQYLCFLGTKKAFVFLGFSRKGPVYIDFWDKKSEVTNKTRILSFRTQKDQGIALSSSVSSFVDFSDDHDFCKRNPIYG